MFIQFIITFSAVFLALIVFQIFKPKQERLFRFARPEDVLLADLGPVFQMVNEQIEKDFKGESFPILITLPKKSLTWTNTQKTKEIICGLLEKRGWVTGMTDKDNTFLLDVLRKKIKQTLQPTS